MYKGRRDFRVGRGMLILVAVATALFALAAYARFRAAGWDWVSIGLALAAVFLGVGGIVETLVLRVQLTDAVLIVTDLRGRRSYEIGTIQGIEEAKGVAPALRLTDGRWIKLPSVGSNLGNSVRAWLKSDGAR